MGDEPTVRKICGAERRTCVCAHHQREHAWKVETQTHRGPCQAADCACGGFQGRRCGRATGLAANGRCSLHGGLSPAGMAHWNFKHGIYTDSLPRDVVDRYKALLQDEELTSVRHEIAVVRANLTLLLERHRDQLWAGARTLVAAREAVAAWAAFQRAKRQGAAVLRAADQALAGQMQVLQDAASEDRLGVDARTEFRKDVLALERLVGREDQRQVNLYSVITAERAFALRQAESTIFIEALNEFIADRELVATIRRWVSAKFAALAGRPDRAALVAVGGRADEPARDPAPAD